MFQVSFVVESPMGHDEAGASSRGKVCKGDGEDFGSLEGGFLHCLPYAIGCIS